MNYINDYSPKFYLPSGYNASISEGVLIGTFVIFINATDMDEGTQGQVYYSIVSGDVGSDFSIDNVSGVVTTHANRIERRKLYMPSLFEQVTEPSRTKFDIPTSP